MEILAPAGNPQALDRAIAAGADAVYLGYEAFSARAGAGNFNEVELQQAVRLAHLHHVRVYVTVNILVKDAEIPQVYEVLKLLEDLRVDGVLVQDLGVLRLARECFPDLPIHASTQMALHNATGARWAKNQGITKVVMARECSLEEIRLACQENVDIEVFGHGAQCVSVSGQCLFSSMVGERSGNRGRCAQPCRMQYTFRHPDAEEAVTAAWLSPRDVCVRDQLPALFNAGVASLKIEGRLKRPEYVAVVASSYRQAAEAVQQNRFETANEEEKRGLQQIFHRGGFMDGYAFHAEDAGVINPSRVSHEGIPIGGIRAVSGGLAKATLALTLNDGDGLQIRGKHGEFDMIYAGKPVPAGEMATLRLRSDMKVCPGDAVIRMTDAAQLAKANALTYAPIPVDMVLEVYPNRNLVLTATDGCTTVTVQGETVQAAQNRALDEDNARKSLEKTGDTPFVLRHLTVRTAGAFVAVSTLNAIRREALEKLAE